MNNQIVKCNFYNIVAKQTGECDICMEARDMEWIECVQCRKSLCSECFSNLKKMSCPSCRFNFSDIRFSSYHDDIMYMFRMHQTFETTITNGQRTLSELDHLIATGRIRILPFELESHN